jgi:type IV pilus assembly protein PilA
MTKKNKKGFTLIELIAVLVVLVIILAIAVPSITGVIKSAKEKVCVLDAGMMEKVAKNIR